MSSSSACLHGDSLRAAAISLGGFAYEGGRKPGLKSLRVGSSVRLRVGLPTAAAGTWVHLGYLQSWRREMGSARLACERPCICSTTGGRRGSGGDGVEELHLHGWNPRERVSVTKIIPVHVRRAARNGLAEGAQCVLRLDVLAASSNSTVADSRGGVRGWRHGASPGGRFVVSHLISGSRDPGPLTWAFDVAGSLLLRPTAS